MQQNRKYINRKKNKLWSELATNFDFKQNDDDDKYCIMQNLKQIKKQKKNQQTNIQNKYTILKSSHQLSINCM